MRERAAIHKPVCWLPTCAEEILDGARSQGRRPCFCSEEHKNRYTNDVRDLRGLLRRLDRQLEGADYVTRRRVESQMGRVRWVLDGYPLAGSRGRLGEAPARVRPGPEDAG